MANLPLTKPLILLHIVVCTSFNINCHANTNLVCPPYLYGDNCEINCHCSGPTCNDTSGICPSVQCEPGYQLPTCSNRKFYHWLHKSLTEKQYTCSLQNILFYSCIIKCNYLITTNKKIIRNIFVLVYEYVYFYL